MEDKVLIRRWLDGERETLAKELGVVPFTLQQRMAEATAKYILATGREYAEQVASVLVRLDYVEDQAMKAWEASKAIRRSRRRSKRVGPDGTSHEDSEAEEDSYGDPKFLNIVLQCARDRAGIMGLEVRRLDVQVTSQIKPQTVQILENVAEYRALSARVTQELAALESSGQEASTPL